MNDHDLAGKAMILYVVVNNYEQIVHNRSLNNYKQIVHDRSLVVDSGWLLMIVNLDHKNTIVKKNGNIGKRERENFSIETKRVLSSHL